MRRARTTYGNHASVAVTTVLVGVLVLALAGEATARSFVVLQPISFARGSDALRTEEVPTIDAVARIFAQYPELARVGVVGHASDDDARGAMERFNLSVRRARTVIDALEDRGVARERLVLLAAGNDQPRDDRRTARGRAHNRRVELVILRHPE